MEILSFSNVGVFKYDLTMCRVCVRHSFTLDMTFFFYQSNDMKRKVFQQRAFSRATSTHFVLFISSRAFSTFLSDGIFINYNPIRVLAFAFSFIRLFEKNNRFFLTQYLYKSRYTHTHTYVYRHCSIAWSGVVHRSILF